MTTLAHVVGTVLLFGFVALIGACALVYAATGWRDR